MADEVLIRLLRSRVGGRVARLGLAESGVRRIAEAIARLRERAFSAADVSR